MRRLRRSSPRGFGRAVSPIAGGRKQEPDVGTRPLEDIIKGIDGVEHNLISPPAQAHRMLRAGAMDTGRNASAAEISSVAFQTFRNRRNRARIAKGSGPRRLWLGVRLGRKARAGEIPAED